MHVQRENSKIECSENIVIIKLNIRNIVDAVKRNHIFWCWVWERMHTSFTFDHNNFSCATKISFKKQKNKEKRNVKQNATHRMQFYSKTLRGYF